VHHLAFSPDDYVRWGWWMLSMPLLLFIVFLTPLCIPGHATRINGHDTTFRVAVNNVTNRRYWEYQYDNYIKPGDPRTFSLSAKLDF